MVSQFTEAFFDFVIRRPYAMPNKCRIVIGQRHETGEVLPAAKWIDQSQLCTRRLDTRQQSPKKMMRCLDCFIHLRLVSFDQHPAMHPAMQGDRELFWDVVTGKYVGKIFLCSVFTRWLGQRLAQPIIDRKVTQRYEIKMRFGALACCDFVPWRIRMLNLIACTRYPIHPLAYTILQSPCQLIKLLTSKFFAGCAGRVHRIVGARDSTRNLLRQTLGFFVHLGPDSGKFTCISRSATFDRFG